MVLMERRRLVSVIVPTRDRPALLRKALASIRAIEGPDICFEILVGDNGNSSETKTIVEAFSGVYLPVYREGAAAARNAGLRVASGEFIAFLDDDDEWAIGNVRPHIKIMDANADVAAVFGQILSVNYNLQPIGDPWPAKWPSKQKLFVTMLSGYYPQIGATVVRVSRLDSIGLMDESLIGDEDWDWQLRIARSHRIEFVDEPCIYFRVRPVGSYDELQNLRIKYCLKVFGRHAWGNLRQWRSPLGLARSYAGATAHYYNYFVDTARDRARNGDVIGARGAILRASRINPVRASKDLWRDVEFRSITMAALFWGKITIKEFSWRRMKQNKA
jgi:glycosyltransferase involved in cell wall biosynthesis